MPSPAATSVGAISQASAIPWSLSQSATSSSRSDASIGDRFGASRELASARAARSATASSLSAGSSLRISRPSFSRISASISRRRALARSTAATGLLQLVGEPGGHRAEGDQPLVALDRVAVLHRLGGEALEQVGRHRVPLPERLAQLGGGELEAAGSPCTARAVAGYTSGTFGRGHVEVEGAGVGAAVVAAHQLELAALHPPRHRQHSRQQHEEARRRSALGVDRRPGRILDDATVGGQPRRVGRRSASRTGTACAARRWTAARPRSLVLQVAVDQLDRHRPFADRRGDPLHRVGPDVAGGEHARRRWPRGSTGRGRGASPAAGARRPSGRDR